MRCFLPLFVAVLALAAAPAAGELIPVELPEAVPCLSDADRAEMRARTEASIASLLAAGRLAPADRSRTTLLAWPIRAADHLGDPGYHATTNFVDHDPNYPDQLRDYECGERSYDTAGGSNHQGTDYVNWPFWWWKMDHDDVEAVAAAPGTIVVREEGWFDRSCEFGGGANYLIIRHADGSTAAYVHMKRWSVTPKQVGETVATGEYLGVVGSAGSSTLPHLHFSVDAPDGSTIDPYAGPCNDLNEESWWLEQRPYFDSAINAVHTHSAPPVFPPCPITEVPNFRDIFQPGEFVYFGIYHRDLVQGQPVSYELRRPDDSVAHAVGYALEDEPFLAAAYWLDAYLLPQEAPFGWWRVVVAYEGETYEKDFVVGGATGVPGAEAAVGLTVSPNPFRGETTIRVAGTSAVRGVDIYSPSGRLVRRLDAAGASESLSWDGRDSAGRALPAGTYLLRVRGGAAERSARVLLLR